MDTINNLSALRRKKETWSAFYEKKVVKSEELSSSCFAEITAMEDTHISSKRSRVIFTASVLKGRASIVSL